MSYTPPHTAFHDLHSRQGFMQPRELEQEVHTVSDGFYVKNHLNMITWYPNESNQRLIVLNDATGEAWTKILEEQ